MFIRDYDSGRTIYAWNTDALTNWNALTNIFFSTPAYALNLDICLPEIPITNSITKEENSAK